MDSDSLLFSLMFTISGVVVGWFLQMMTSEIRERREVKRAVSMAAATCFGRLKKMEMARQQADQNVFNDEKMYLGGDSDRYLQALSRRSKIDSHEMAIYERLGGLLIGLPKEQELDEYIAVLIEDVQAMIIYAG